MMMTGTGGVGGGAGQPFGGGFGVGGGGFGGAAQPFAGGFGAPSAGPAGVGVGVGVGACPGREPVWGTAGRCTADLWVAIAIAIAIAVSPGSFVSTAGRVGL